MPLSPPLFATKNRNYMPIPPPPNALTGDIVEYLFNEKLKIIQYKWDGKVWHLLCAYPIRQHYRHAYFVEQPDGSIKHIENWQYTAKRAANNFLWIFLKCLEQNKLHDE